MSAKGQSAEGMKTVTDADAGIKVEFARENAVVLSLKGVSFTRIDDLRRLSSDLYEKYSDGLWDIDYCVVTEIAAADSGTILVSGSRDSSVELKAAADIGPQGLTLANADAKLGITYSSGMHTQVVAKQGITPLFRAHYFPYRTDIFGIPIVGAGDFELA